MTDYAVLAGLVGVCFAAIALLAVVGAFYR